MFQIKWNWCTGWLRLKWKCLEEHYENFVHENVTKISVHAVKVMRIRFMKKINTRKQFISFLSKDNNCLKGTLMLAKCSKSNGTDVQGNYD